MADLKSFSRMRQRLFWAAQALFWGSALFMAVDIGTEFPTTEKGAFLVPTLVVMAAGVTLYMFSRRLPLPEVLDLARQRGGKLTLSDITSELGIDVRTAEKTIEVLKAKRLARSAMIIQQDLVIFPDSYHLPEEQTLAVAQTHDGRLTVALLRQELGLDRTTAEETLRNLEMQGYLRAGDLEGTLVWTMADSGLLTPKPAGSRMVQAPDVLASGPPASPPLPHTPPTPPQATSPQSEAESA